MNRLIPLIAAASLCGGVAFAQAPARPMPDSNMAGGASQATMAFVQKAQAGSHFEIETGKLAAQQASDARVKQFGKMMVKDHGKAAKNLTAAIKSDRKAGLPEDTPMDAEQTSQFNQLKGLQGAAFDSQYVDIMLKDHQQDASEFADYPKSGGDPKIKAFAARTETVIRMHLKHVQQLQGSANKSAAR